MGEFSFKKIFEFEGEVVGARKARSQAIRYFFGFKKAAEIRRRCGLISSFEDFLEIFYYVKSLIDK